MKIDRTLKIRIFRKFTDWLKEEKEFSLEKDTFETFEYHPNPLDSLKSSGWFFLIWIFRLSHLNETENSPMHPNHMTLLDVQSGPPFRLSNCYTLKLSADKKTHRSGEIRKNRTERTKSKEPKRLNRKNRKD